MKISSYVRPFCCVAALVVSSFGTAKHASAELLVDLQNGLIGPTLSPGQSVTLDVFLSSDVNDDLEAFTFFLNIAPDGDAGLEFIDPQSEDYLNDIDYVFFDNSDVKNNGGFATSVSTDFEMNDTLGVDDFFDDPNFNDFDTPIDGTPVLIARYEIQALASATPGDTFEITVDDTSDFATFDFADFTSNSLTVTIGAAAVPEPSSFVLLGLFGAPVLLRRRRR